jgi:hypothetical protein
MKRAAYQFLQRSEAAKAFQLVRESTRNNVVTVFWATGTLDGKPQTIDIPVDSVTKRIMLTFSVDTKGSEFKLTQPSGGTITEGSADAEITELACGKILTVNSPEAGECHAEIAGMGRFWIEAQAQSDGGRSGHEGLFRIQGQPVAGIPAILRVSISAGAGSTAEFYLVSERGSVVHLSVSASKPTPNPR